MTTLPPHGTAPQPREHKLGWIWDILLVVIILAGAYFRFVGFQWDENQHLHPDERFLTMVETGISPVETPGQYFDTAQSTLNPANSGNTFYVYGTLPLFMVRYAAEWVGMTGYDQVHLVGRFFSALMDLLSVFVLYLLVLRLYRNPRMALLAAAFLAVAVQPIQQSHFFTTDNFVTFFVLLTVYFAVVVATGEPLSFAPALIDAPGQLLRRHWKTSLPYLGFGISLGCAMASKVSAAPVALLVPLAAWILYRRSNPEERNHLAWISLRNLVIAALVAFVTFRIFQPYAFTGPGFFGLNLNPQWISNLRELSNLSSGDVDFPPALQWARRPVTFAWSNMVKWGMGYPLGLLAWAGFLWMGWRILRGEWKEHMIVWAWTAAYFTWQSVNFTRAMRYQLPIYPTLILVAAWLVFTLWKNIKPAWRWKTAIKALLVILATGTLVATAGWAYAFTRIYTRPHTRIEASRWIFSNVPGPINLSIQTDTDTVRQMLPFPDNYQVTVASPFATSFTPIMDGWISEIDMPRATMVMGESADMPSRMMVELKDITGEVIASGEVAFTAPGQTQAASVTLSPVVALEKTKSYQLQFSLPEPTSVISLDGQIAMDIQQTTGIQFVPIGNARVTPAMPVVVNFTATESGKVGYIEVPAITPNETSSQSLTFVFTLVDFTDTDIMPVFTPEISVTSQAGEPLPPVAFPATYSLIAGHEYALTIEVRNGEYQDLSGDLAIYLTDAVETQVLPPVSQVVNYATPYRSLVVAEATGMLTDITVPHLQQIIADASSHNSVVTVKLTTASDQSRPLGVASLQGPFPNGSDGRGELQVFKFAQPIPLVVGGQYLITVEVSGTGGVTLHGSAPANESTWDDGLPLRMDGYDGYGGLYQRDLVFEMYWDDNAEKLERFVSTLNQADYIFISSNRQWGTTIRVPERYPLTSAYYRLLIGCPEDQDLFACYADAQPGDMQGQLGFDLVKVFQGSPNLGSITFNTQYAEEAFTVYDNPKVLIFKKTADFNVEQVRVLLSSVDLSQVIHLTPLQASKQTNSNLMLDEQRRQSLTNAGTWSQMFDTNALQNHFPALAVVYWYLAVTLLGWITYPTTRLVFRGLRDRGYAITKLFALILITWVVWMVGSVQIPVTRMTITVVVVLVFALNGYLFLRSRQAILGELRQGWRYILVVEAVALAFFLLDLFIRVGNPDLWHPWKGGEKPMDFSYFNAVIKSTTFPPYDPWYAGGYINYYYYGFVIAGMLVKWLGIVPAIAYNIIIPGMFSMAAMCAFAFGWNVAMLTRRGGESAELHLSPTSAGILSALAVMVVGNLGSVRMIWQGFQKLVAPGGNLEGVSIFQNIAWFVQGVGQYFKGVRLPYAVGDWYWIPSRVLPGEPITEFPFFTYIYADLHAHLLALPITLLVLLWTLSVIHGGLGWKDELRWRNFLGWLPVLCAGGLIIGTLRPTNTWDLPVYLVLALLGVLYTVFKATPAYLPLGQVPLIWQKSIAATGAAVLLGVFTWITYLPFGMWYAQGYNSVAGWTGPYSPLKSYLTHWGLFLFIILTWLVWEVRDWLANVPATVLLRLKPYRIWLLSIGIGVFLFGVVLTFMGIEVAWVVLLIGVLAAVLLLRQDMPNAKRMILFMVGTGMALTLAVEMIVLVGDIGRMNTVFKFYMQAWSLLALSAAAGLCWLLPSIWGKWKTGWANLWQVGLIMLVFGAALFPVLGSADKVRDRMVSGDQAGLDGLAFMQGATYYDMDQAIDLAVDYRGIRWMQDNVTGSPVIVEANTVEYKWGSRFTIYTGLPGVVGWNWHQRQQRGSVVPSEWVQNRVDEVGRFFTSTDRENTIAFIEKYHVKYIIVGQLEHAYYSGEGLVKFSAWEGDLWKAVYTDGPLTIYEVIDHQDG